jgi:hypothetical protein
MRIEDLSLVAKAVLLVVCVVVLGVGVVVGAADEQRREEIVP